MAERYLIDTSGVIKYLNETLPSDGLSFPDEIVDHESIISFITEIELLVSDSTVIGINTSIIEEAIRLRKSYKLKLPDAIIAATATTNNWRLISDNDKDFMKVPVLKYRNPQKL